MKNRVLFERGIFATRELLHLLMYSEVKQGDTNRILEFINGQVSKIDVPENVVVHWDNTKLELMTASVTEITRLVLLIGKEVNTIRAGQRKSIKNFIKEAQISDEHKNILARRKQEEELKGRLK